MNDYSEYTCKISELIEQIIRKERLPKPVADKLRTNVKLVDDDTVYYKDYPYKTPLIFINPYVTLDDIFETRIKEHMKNHIMLFSGIGVTGLSEEDYEDLFDE